MARLRLLLLLALAAVAARGLPGISAAEGARDGARGSTAARSAASHRPGARTRARPVRCARAVSFHTGSRPASHHAHRRCRRNTHRRTRRRHRPTHPAHHTSAADVNGECTDAQLTPSVADLERVRAAVLCLVNRERVARGESALAPNAALGRAAQSHTESMAFGDYFEHVGPGGDTPVARLRSAGYLTGSGGFEVGENIAWGTLWLGTPRAIVAAWMASPGHRANILDARFRDTAVGVSPHPPASLAHGQAGAVYTQDFAVILGR